MHEVEQGGERAVRAIVEAERELKAAADELEHHSSQVRELAAKVALLSSRIKRAADGACGIALTAR